MIIALTILIFVIIAAIDVPPLIKNKQKRELIVFCVLFVFAFTIAILQSMDIKVPSPIKGVIYLVKDVLHISYK